MGVSSPTVVDEHAALYGRSHRDQRPVIAEREIVKRAEAPRHGSAEADPLAQTLSQLADQAPHSRRLEAYARALIRTTLGPQYEGMNDRRSELVRKELVGSLTPKEHARLDYLRWQLDQIEEALLGDQWDLMQAAVARQAALARDMQVFIDELKAATPTAFRTRK